MEIQVISYGQTKSGTKTAQIVAKHSGKSFTHHLQFNGVAWNDKLGRMIDLKKHAK